MMTTAIKKAQQHDNQLTSIHSDLLQVFSLCFENYPILNMATYLPLFLAFTSKKQ